jgi:hypothetical protein
MVTTIHAAVAADNGNLIVVPLRLTTTSLLDKVHLQRVMAIQN